jgi:hypothetical protein
MEKVKTINLLGCFNQLRLILITQNHIIMTKFCFNDSENDTQSNTAVRITTKSHLRVWRWSLLFWVHSEKKIMLEPNIYMLD